MPAPDAIRDLIERFQRNAESYRSPAYNETQARREFIDPMFKALGWDVDNVQGYAEAYKDVVHEESLKIGAVTKAPDYSFRVGGARKFFLEAKKPAARLGEDPAPAYQLRRYAWSAKLSLSVLTNFAEFAVYDCRVRPDQNDKPSTARILYLSHAEYVERWDEIASIFSREAVLRGSFDKYAESAARKKGTAEVDAAFLAEIETWREELARVVALRNPGLSERDLNFAVQQTIDRIVFLRICEDRGIEDYGRLQALQNGTEVYARLRHFYEQADQRYNSGLFHFHREKDRHGEPDTLTPSLAIDDKVLKDVVRGLYYPESPYEFSVLPADILGQVYERFLGKVIRLTAGGRAVVEEKPEVRKAGGVYYTPTYIVDYIVRQTVGKLLGGRAPGPRGSASRLRILDPACGSGSFLLGAYEYLLKWHLEQYTQKDDPRKWAKGRNPAVFQDRRGDWRLTTGERKRILLNNIYGVDIDSQAVEVTKLSLLLKVLEDENAETLQKQLAFHHERALPDLGANVKCGNSLIGPDFFNGHQGDMFDEDETQRINAFDWKKEFPEAIEAGGFDAVIGNPPYGASFSSEERDYLKEKFRASVGRGESYLLFLERVIGLLVLKGRLGYIVPDTYLNLGFTQVIRSLILQNTLVKEVVLLPARVFPDAVVDTTLLLLEKSPVAKSFHESKVLVKIFPKGNRIGSTDDPHREIRVSTATWFREGVFGVQGGSRSDRIVKKLERGRDRLGNMVEMYSGVKAYEVGKGCPPQTSRIRDAKPFTSARRTDSSWSPFFDGRHVGRYQLLWRRDNWLKYGPWLAAPRKAANFAGEKLLIRKIVSSTLTATYFPSDCYSNTLLFVLKAKRGIRVPLKGILAILNSKLIGWYFRTKFQITDSDTFPQIMIRDILQFPMPSPGSRGLDRADILASRMIELHAAFAKSKTPHDKTVLRRRIEATDREIDRLVYELYGLTDEEIATVEKG